MCGICGVYEYENKHSVSRDLLPEMLAAIRHRGPDDQGTYFCHNLAIGMRRLSIIDLVSGQQPITNEDGRVIVVFNGEIYNYKELRHNLGQRGHIFATASDTEVIVHLYEDLGEECVNELRGMFSFALWDTRQQRLLLARDRLGIKPLYFSNVDGCLVFGSEIKALLQHPQVQARLSLEGLSSFLSLRYIPAPQTMFAGIASLPPGHTLSCDRYGTKVKCYWDLSFTSVHMPQNCNEQEYAEQLEELLQEVIRLHLMSDVPFGAFLSGGVDSSTVVALMSHILEMPVRTFSVGFEGSGSFSELPYARLVANRYHSDHHEVLMTPTDFVEVAERVIWHLDQPIGDMAEVANYLVSELAARHVKMVLTGEGGDELFAGYARYSGDRLSAISNLIPRPARNLAAKVSTRLPGMRRQKLAIYALSQPHEAGRFANWFALFNPDLKRELLTREAKDQLNGWSAEEMFASYLERTDAKDRLNRMLYVDTKLWLADDLLLRGDKMSMAASLEARVPLLDHKLVEFAAALPPHLKLKGLQRKYLLKKVARRWLPNEIIDRRKKGFPTPLSMWFRKETLPFVRDILSVDAMRRRGLFNPRYVETLLEQHVAGTADFGLQLWALLGVELWHRVFVDANSRRFQAPCNPVIS